jgi:2-(1,2-epoxy-1,2-dihydrophenyl)acetyl-CoA isomerase
LLISRVTEGMGNTMRTDFQHVLVAQDGAVLTVTMNRPEVLNAFNSLMLQEMIEVVEVASQDTGVRCLVIKGSGRAFGSGQDLSVFFDAHVRSEVLDVSGHLQSYHKLINLIRAMPKPVIAAIHGVAAGISLNIALACDLRIAADNARFTEAFARIGLVPDAGGAYFLPRLIGLAKALEMALLTDEINAVEAERIGLINKCVPVAEFEAETHALARRLAVGPTRTYGYIKELFYSALDLDLPAVLDLEGKLQAVALATEDHHEGVEAFLQKRSPKYSGK